MDERKRICFTKYAEAYDVVKEYVSLKSDDEDLETLLKILDLIHEKDVSVRRALDMLEDAKTIMMEMVRA